MYSFINNFELKPPPLMTIQIKKAQFVERLHPHLDKFLCQKGLLEELEHSAALIGRLMARRKNSFGKMLGFKAICKLNSALCRLLRLDLPRILDNFRGTLPDIVVGGTTLTDVPTRNSFDYVLVNLINAFRIYQRINNCCIEACDYVVKVMNTNYFMEINTFFLAVIARIRKQSITFENNCANLYCQLFPFRQCFPQNANNMFLPKSVELPEQLSANTLKSCKLDNEDLLSHKFEPKVSLLASKPDSNFVLKCKQMADDVGTEINRKSIKPPFDVEQLRTIEAIKKFIMDENKARKSSPTTCITKAILKHEWKGAVKIFEKKVLSNEQKKACLLFQKFLKCKI